MGFEQFRGNRTTLDSLRGMLQRERLPHALLLAGPAGVGKYTLALMLAKALHCEVNDHDFCGVCAPCRALETIADRRRAVAQAEEERESVTKRPREIPLVIQPHADVAVLAPNGPLRLFQIEQARHLKQTLEFMPTGSRRRIFILPDAERMDSAAANSLLKSLEEPPEHTVMVLTTAREAALLPTIRSRCVPLWFAPLQREEVVKYLEERGVGENRKEREWRASVTAGSPGAALRLDRVRYLAQRDALLALLAAGAGVGGGAGGNFSELLAQAQKLSGKEVSLENLLEILYILLQDILHIESRVNGEPIRNTDRPKSLMQVAGALGIDGLRQAAASLDQLERNLRRNVPVRLSLEALALDLSAGSAPDCRMS